MTPTQVEEAIERCLVDLEQHVTNVARLANEAAHAEVDFKVAFSKARLRYHGQQITDGHRSPSQWKVDDHATLATKAEAKLRADNIRHHAESLWGLLLAAWENDDHLALGYETWHAYVQGEFDMTRTHAYRLLDQARITLAIEEAVHDAAPNDTNGAGSGAEPGVDLSRGVTPRNRMQRNHINPVVTNRDAQVLRRDIPKVAEEVARDVKQGAQVQEAVRAAVARRTPVQVPRAGSWHHPAVDALLAVNPTEEGKRAGRPGLTAVRQMRLWLDRFEGAIKGAQPIVTQEACLHPMTRRIGKGCGACGKEKV